MYCFGSNNCAVSYCKAHCLLGKKASLKAELKSLNNELSDTDAKTKPFYNEITAVKKELNNYEAALEDIDKYETRCNRLLFVSAVKDPTEFQENFLWMAHHTA